MRGHANGGLPRQQVVPKSLNSDVKLPSASKRASDLSPIRRHLIFELLFGKTLVFPDPVRVLEFNQDKDFPPVTEEGYTDKKLNGNIAFRDSVSPDYCSIPQYF